MVIWIIAMHQYEIMTWLSSVGFCCFIWTLRPDMLGRFGIEISDFEHFQRNMAVFSLLYRKWLASKGIEHLVVVTKSTAILRLIRVTFPMGLCLSAQNGLYFSDLCLLVVPFVVATTCLLIFYFDKQGYYWKGLLPGIPGMSLTSITKRLRFICPFGKTACTLDLGFSCPWWLC